VLNNVPEYLSELQRGARAPVFSMSTDQEEIGRIQARQFAALLPRGGTVLYIQGPSEHFAAKQRTVGMQGTLASNLRTTALRANWTAEGAARSVSSWLKLNAAGRLRVDLVSAQNDLMALAARRVFQETSDLTERDRWLSLPFTGCDGLLKTGQAWVREGLLSATVIMPPSSGEALRLMLNFLPKPEQVQQRNWLLPESFPPLEQLRPVVVASP
jgi:ribose transport system substrate-binding protein